MSPAFFSPLHTYRLRRKPWPLRRHLHASQFTVPTFQQSECLKVQENLNCMTISGSYRIRRGEISRPSSCRTGGERPCRSRESPRAAEQLLEGTAGPAFTEIFWDPILDEMHRAIPKARGGLLFCQEPTLGLPKCWWDSKRRKPKPSL